MNNLQHAKAPATARFSMWPRVFLALAIAYVPASHAQTDPPVDHASHRDQPAAAVPQELPFDGEVRRVDPAAGKVTLRHGPLVALDMPAMTMVFIAAAPTLLDGLKAGDKVRFRAEKQDGTLVLTAIRTGG